MSFFETLQASADGWFWPKPEFCLPTLMPIVSNLMQVRQNIYKTVEGLPEKHLWVRITPKTPAIGNLLLHLAGTEHEWIGVKIGRLPLKRDRNLEFGTTGGKTLPELLASMRTIEAQTQAVLSAINPNDKGEVDGQVHFNLHYTVQHLAYHSGQLVTLRKMFEPDFQVYPAK